MNFSFKPLAIPEVILIEPKIFRDTRGFLMESYRYSAFCQGGIVPSFVQDNRSRSVQGTLRGLHYQNPPHAQAKLVSALRGEVLDVAVDIRRASPTYGAWVSAVLSEANCRQLYIPAGFAHGVYVLSPEAELSYKMTTEYRPAYERGIVWNDPALGIDWGTTSPLLSEKDQALPVLSEADNGFVYGEM